MKSLKDGERLAILETNMKNIEIKINSIENSVKSLHGKFDTFVSMLSENYVAKETFIEYKRTRTMDRILVALITAIISGLVAFFLRERGF